MIERVPGPDEGAGLKPGSLTHTPKGEDMRCDHCHRDCFVTILRVRGPRSQQLCQACVEQERRVILKQLKERAAS